MKTNDQRKAEKAAFQRALKEQLKEGLGNLSDLGLGRPISKDDLNKLVPEESRKWEQIHNERK